MYRRVIDNSYYREYDTLYKEVGTQEPSATRAILRRQAHGIRAKSITVSLPGAEVDRLRSEATSEGITPSARAARLIKLGRKAEELGMTPDAEPAEAAS